MKHHSYSSTLGVLAVVVTLVSSMYLISSVITSTVTSVPPVAEVISAVSVFKLSPSSLSLVVTGDKTTFNNSVGVSLPGMTGSPAWSITNTAPWNTFSSPYGKGKPNGYGAGTIKWTTNLTGYAPGTYTDTITLSSTPENFSRYGSVTLIDTVQVLSSSSVPPVSTPKVNKFKIGDTIQTTDDEAVRSAPSLTATTLGYHSSKGSQGTVVAGPFTADGLNWWQINFATGSDGWSVENYLTLAPTSPPTPTPTPTPSSGAYKLSPSSVSLEIPADNAPFNNEVGVSLPGFTDYPLPAWYLTNTAPWNTLEYHFGKGQPNGYGPGTIQWTTNLAGYPPGTYTDTITLKGGDLKSVNLVDTVKVLPKGVPPVTTPPPSAPVVTITANPTAGTVNVVNPSLTWTATNSPTSCTASGDWSGTKAVSGGTNVAQGVLATVKTYTYTLTCANASGASAPKSATVVVSALSNNPTATGYQARSLVDQGTTYKYKVFIPAGYDPSKKYPVVMFLHGSGERGTDNQKQLTVGLGQYISANLSSFPAIAIFPQFPITAEGSVTLGSTAVGSPVGSARLAMEALNQTENEFNTDRTRIYLTGLSMGGGLDWDVAYFNPTIFAAMVPFSGDIYPSAITGSDTVTLAAVLPQVIQKLQSLPIWMQIGASDTTVSVSDNRAIYQAFQNAGSPIKYTERAGYGHNGWNIWYADPNLWSWLFSKSTNRVVTPPPPPPSTDTQAPTAPTGLSATAFSSGQINLSWISSTDNVGVTGYKVYRGGVQISTSATNSYSDTGLSASTLYSYKVSAYDGAGNNSAQSGSVGATTLTLAPPPPLGTLQPHPRVWMTPARVTFLKAQVAANTSRWQKVKAAADAQVAMGTTYTGSSGTGVDLLPDLCLAYLATGIQSYATRAGVILTNYAVETNVLSGDDGYPNRFYLPLVSMGLDWCYNGLTVAEHQQAATWLMNRADWVWPESTPSRAGGWSVNSPTRNYWWGFMMTGPAALAAAGDDTGTGTFSGSNRPAFHEQLALTKWNTLAVPVFASSSLGGGFTEGTNYGAGDTWYVARFADAFQTAGTQLTNPFFEASVRWWINVTMPGNQYLAPFGIQPRVSTAPVFIYEREAVLDMLAIMTPNPTLAAQAQLWLNSIGQIPTAEFNETAVLAEELLRYDPTQTAATDLSALPLDYYAAGAGLFVYRQSWADPNATVMTFDVDRGSLTGNANGLMIWKGAFWISGSGNLYSSSGIDTRTSSYNNLTVGGAGQVINFASSLGQVVATQVSNSLVVVRGQAKDTYGYPPGTLGGRNVVSDYLRTVAYLPPQDTFVIVDRATAVDPTAQKVWRWQSKNPAVISGNTFTLANPAGDQRCVGTVLLPIGAVLGTQALALGTPGVTTSNAVTVTLPTGNATDVVVTTLQCSGLQPVTASSDGTNINATVGATHVTIPLNGAQSVTLY